MPKVAWVVDRVGWAQWRRGIALAQQLPEFGIEVGTHDKLFGWRKSYGSRTYDGIFYAGWRHGKEALRYGMGPAKGYGAGVGSHYELGPDLHSMPKRIDPDRVFRKSIRILQRFPVVLAHSERLWHLLRPYLPQCEYAPLGVDADYFRPVKDRRSGPPWIVGWLGREKAAKNTSLLRELTEEIRTHALIQLDIRLVGRDEQPRLTQDAVRHLYQWQWDFCLNVSLSEGMSNVLLESAACGLPAITTDVGDHCKLVKEGETGFVIDPTAESLIGCIEQLQHVEAHEYRRLSEAIRAEILENWTWEKRVGAYRTALGIVCGG